MPYILKKTDGSTLTTVQDASIDNSTSLIFVGRNYSGYGQPVEENFIKLLENFSNTYLCNTKCDVAMNKISTTITKIYIFL